MNLDSLSSNKFPLMPDNIKTGLPQTPQDAKNAYWGLGENWWMQIIDGDVQEYGPKVFDEGLHGRNKEPGYLEGIKKGSDLCAEHLMERPSKEFYKALHKTACAHFKGSENSTLIDASEAGTFRSKFVFFSQPYKKQSKESHELYNAYEEKRMSRDLTEYFQPKFSLDPKVDPIELWMNDDSYKNAPDLSAEDKNLLSRVKASEQHLRGNAKKVSAFIEKFSKELGLVNPIATIDDESSDIFVVKSTSVLFDKKTPLPEQIEVVVDKLFHAFNDRMDGIEQEMARTTNPEKLKALKDQKLECVADLYQKLEWLHPFQDGQGRTDLLLLSKLLTEHAGHPAILEKPYMCGTVPLSEWVDYLKKGLEAWEIEKSKQAHSGG